MLFLEKYVLVSFWSLIVWEMVSFLVSFLGKVYIFLFKGIAYLAKSSITKVVYFGIK